jgi:hypothetical protein
MKHVNRRGAVLAAAAVVMSTLPGQSASPVIAAVTAACQPGAGAGAGSTARGGVLREPAQTHQAIEAGSNAKSGPGFQANVAVYFHVIRKGATGNVTAKQIDDEIGVMNRTYAGAEGGSNTGFTFTLAGVDRTANAAWYNAGPDTQVERTMKRALHKGGLNALNLYSNSGGGFLGWATFPTRNPAEVYLDGVVMDWRSMLHTSNAYAGKYDEGKTATHETGHWLNVYHVFEGGCSNPGDHVADTPPQATPTSGCPAGKDTCSQPGKDAIHNYMDYSYDPCYNNFTPGQIKRMRDAWLALRASG